MSFPVKLIRGISDKNHINSDHEISSGLFDFDEKFLRDSDGFIELSINWYDDENALSVTFNQKKNDLIQFKFGAAIVAKSEIDRIKNAHSVNDKLSYERNERDDNKYHGNLLLKRDVSKRIRKNISAAIALHVVDVVFPQSNK